MGNPPSATLAFYTGSKAGTVVDLDGTEFSIGRAFDETIRFAPDEVVVSANHAMIVVDDDGYLLRDLGSRNGTLVNKKKIVEHRLVSGDEIEFGPGGPMARFSVVGQVGDIYPTVEVVNPNTASGMIHQAREAVDRQRDLTAQAPMRRSLTTTREWATSAYRRSSRRTRIASALVLVLSLSAIGILGVMQSKRQRSLEQALARVADQLDAERDLRGTLQANLSDVQARYDSLLQDVETNQQELVARTASLDPGTFSETVTRTYSGGVALVVFSYGFADETSGQLLRFAVAEDGGPIADRTRDGRLVPRFTFEGNGPAVTEEGSATGFLIDSLGSVVTNQHVAEPWFFDDGLATLQSNGLDVRPVFVELRAYFPPGNRSYPMRVERVSTLTDVALLRSTAGPIAAPILPLAQEGDPISPGQQLVFIGYPTGVHNLLFRVSREERSVILDKVGENPVALARELGTRGLIQPLSISGSVSDTTSSEIIHTAAATGGASGGPLIAPGPHVVGIHYASVRSPIAGDPFQTQRAVRVRFLRRLQTLAGGG